MRLEANFLPLYDRAMVKPDRPRPYADIAERLRLSREAIGDGQLTQKAFAAEAGVGYEQYKNWESGAYRISVDGARALRKRYGLSLDFIYEGNVDALPMNLRNALSQRLLDR